MVDPVRVEIDASGLASGFAEAGAEVERVAREEIAPAAEAIEAAFSRASRSIETELATAARRGALSLKDLGRAVASDLAGLAIDGLVRAPIENAVSGLISGAFGGARAEGGPVRAGLSYLVGERGPEVFTPAASGGVSGDAGARPVVVNVTMQNAAPAGVARSEGQIAAALARAARRGLRNL